MSRIRTTFEDFEERLPHLLRQEELILSVTEELASSLRASGLSKSELAQRLGRSKAFVSQVLGGGNNLTLRTLSDFAMALDAQVEVRIEKRFGLLQWPKIESEVTAVDSGDGGAFRGELAA